MSFYNRVSFAGKLVGEPIVYAGSNYTYVSFGISVPVGKSQREDKSWKTETDIFNVKLSGEAAGYGRECFEKGLLKKGTEVTVHGRLVIDRYTNNDNQPVEKIVVKVSRMDESFDINFYRSDDKNGESNGYNSNPQAQGNANSGGGVIHENRRYGMMAGRDEKIPF